MADVNSTPYGRVYLVTNLLNGKRYVGQTIMTIAQRWSKHCRSGSRCPALYSAIKKYGPESFSIEEIGAASTPEELDRLEAQAVESHDCLAPKGYNLREGGHSRGRLTDAMKETLRHSMRTRWQDPDYRARMVAAHKTPEYLNGLRERLGARPDGEAYKARLREKLRPSEEKKQELKARRSERMKNLWSAGFLSTEEGRRKHAEAVREAANRPEKKARQSEIQKARWASPEGRVKMLNALKVSEERRRASIRAAYDSEEVRAARSALMQAMWGDPEFQARMRSPEMKARRSELAKAGNTPDVRARNAETQRKRWEDPEYRAKMMEMINSPEVRAKREAASKRRWDKYRAEQAAK